MTRHRPTLAFVNRHPHTAAADALAKRIERLMDTRPNLARALVHLVDRLLVVDAPAEVTNLGKPVMTIDRHDDREGA